MSSNGLDYLKKSQEYKTGKITYKAFYTWLINLLEIDKDDFPSAVNISLKAWENGVINFSELSYAMDILDITDYTKQEFNIRNKGIRKGIKKLDRLDAVNVLKRAVQLYLEGLK